MCRFKVQNNHNHENYNKEENSYQPPDVSSVFEVESENKHQAHLSQDFHADDIDVIELLSL